MIDNELLRKLQMKEYEILLEVDRICKKEGIQYFLACGTLLGAVRNQGFIPWDDDLDICMKYADYLRFQEVCKTELNEKFFLQTEETDPNSHLSWHKLRQNNTTLIIDTWVERDMHHGINIDIYPLFSIADGKYQRKIQYLFTSLYLLMCVGEVPKNHGTVMKIGSKIILGLLSEKMQKKLQQFCLLQISRYEKKPTRYRAILAGNISKKARHLFPSECFDGAEEMLFESQLFPVPRNPEVFLREYFGPNYLMPTPEENRGDKHIHVIKIDTENSYLNYRGKLYCVKE